MSCPSLPSQLWITMDSLRYDVAQECFEANQLPTLSKYLPTSGWEKRWTPANFTFPAHQAFFAGFWPKPIAPGLHKRKYALAKDFGKPSQTMQDGTWRMQGTNLPDAFQRLGYTTLCIGGVDFFSKQNALGRVLPNMFSKSSWQPDFSQHMRTSTAFQVHEAIFMLQHSCPLSPILLFLNISATHEPTSMYLDGCKQDCIASQKAALQYADKELGKLFDWIARDSKRKWEGIICSDHGDAFGEDGYFGHGIAHPVVMTVPYAEWLS